MRKLPVFILSLLLVPAIASAQSAGPPPPPPDAQGVETARPADAQPDVQPPPPPAVPPSYTPNEDQVGILQGGGDGEYSAQAAPASPPSTQTGQWVYTSQYGWVWMPYGQQYVDEGAYGAASPYQYVYCGGVGWSWIAAPWLWGWGPYPYFGVWGPSRFGWYRGLFRSGYGWGRYRGGAPRPYAGGFGRGYGAYHATRPLGGGYVSRSYGSTRFAGPVKYGAAPSRAGTFAARPFGSSGGRSGSFPHATAGAHVGGGHRR